MALSASTTDGGNVVKIDMPEKFNFDIHSDLRKVYESNPGVKKYIINLKRTNYLDSSALGMILLLREKAGDTVDSVQVINASGNVREILDIANFNKMVTID